MAKADIFSKVPDLNYSEPALNTDFNAFKDVVNSRRSIRVYDNTPIPESVMRECLDLAVLAPNSSNLQPWEFFWVRSPEKKAELVRLCLSQPSAKTAQELVVAVARPDYWKINRDRMIEVLDQNGVKGAGFQYYHKVVPLAYGLGFMNLKGFFKKLFVFFRGLTQVTPRIPTSGLELELWAQKSTALACQNLMLSLRAAGFDSCPMEGMDGLRVRKLLNLPAGAKICMVISAGKRASNGVYGPRIRFNNSYFIHEV
ncbi:MAG: nitroreductase family protein [Sphingobacteriaceae bacterium]